MTRSDTDSWDLASSVGATATMVAAARALASEDTDPIISDPFAAPLVRAVGNADYRLPHTGGSTPAGIPQASVTSEDAELIAHLAAQGKVRIHMVLTSQTGAAALGHNVVADLKGSEHPEQIVVMSRIASEAIATAECETRGSSAVTRSALIERSRIFSAAS